jgi:hypothetical protein
VTELYKIVHSLYIFIDCIKQFLYLVLRGDWRKWR